jgi:hypothetical protein
MEMNYMKMPKRPTQKEWKTIHYRIYYGNTSICGNDLLEFQVTRDELKITCQKCIKMLPEFKEREGNY